MSRYARNVLLVLAGALILPLSLQAQLQLGDNLNLRANGTISAGYNGDYGNLTSSDHSLGVGGSGSASGYYYNPNLFSFNVSPYYNQARDNSSYRSISDASGATASASIFSGSPFPGTISLSKAYDSEGSYAIPGVADYVTHGNSDSIGIAWGEHIHGLPSVSASFQRGASQNSIYGSNDTGTSTSHSFTVGSNYTLAGFGLGASVFTGAASSEFPEILAGGGSISSSSSSNHGYTFTVSHRLPLNGSFSSNYSSSSVDSSYAGANVNESVSLLNLSSAVQPTQKLHVSFNMGYSSNLSGSIEQAVVAAGGVVSQSIQSPPSHAYDYTGAIGYAILPNLRVQGEAERRVQDFLGTTYGGNNYNGSVSYWHGIFGGNFSAALSMGDGTTDNSPDNTLGYTVATSYNRRVGAWNVTSSFDYEQNVQTLLVTYLSSSYSYSGSVRRRWRHIGWTLGGGASTSGLSGQSGTSSHSESLSTGLSFGRMLTANGAYSKSSGNGILTPTGIMATPVPSPVLPASSVILYGGDSYSFSVGSSPLRRLTMSASWAKALSNSASATIGAAGSTNTTEMFNSIIQYQFRKMYLTGGFSRLTQGFTASGTSAQTISSYYIGVSRWFNFF